MYWIRIRLVKGTKGCYVAHFVTSTLLVCLVDLIDRSIRFSRFARAARRPSRGTRRPQRRDEIYAPRGPPARGRGRLHGTHTTEARRADDTDLDWKPPPDVGLAACPRLKGSRPANPSAQASYIRLIEKAVSPNPDTSNR